MQISPGDRVSFINDNLNGTVKRIIDKKKVLLLLDDGFEIPANISELIVTESASGNKPYEDGNQGITIADDFDLSDKLYFAALQDETDKGLMMKTYLINTTPNLVYFAIYKTSEGKTSGMAHGSIEPSRALNLFSFMLSDASQYKNITLQYLSFSESTDKITPPVQLIFRLKPVPLLNERHMIPVLKKQGFLIDLSNINPEINTEGSEFMRLSQKTIQVPDIIDLHLEELTETPKSLNPTEAIQLQMSIFNQSLEKAIAHDLDSITFIHGIGKGVLKNEIRKILGSNPHIQGFSDADPKKFGHGATIVYLKNR